MQFFLPKTDPDVCKYQPDIIRSEGPDFTFHNFDVFTSAKKYISTLPHIT